MSDTLLQTELPGLKLAARGKVRDVYDLGDRLLIVATDRISAFDVVLPNGVPDKGAVLTQLSAFWFGMTKGTMPNHLLAADPAEFPAELSAVAQQAGGRAMLVKKAERVEVECIVRGYISGSAWTEYAKQGTICGETMPPALVESAKLSAPIFTPSTKADTGHDENISRARLASLVGNEMAARLEQASLSIYAFAEEYARKRGIIIADTKMEFGIIDGQLILIDELLTPDSSRFWATDTYVPGQSQPSFDKQFVRDWLTASGWNKEPPAPVLPDDIIEKTAEKYRQAYERLTGHVLPSFA